MKLVLAGAAALGVLAVGCYRLPSDYAIVARRSVPAAETSGTLSIVLRPRVIASVRVQAIPSLNTAASIARLDVVPTVEAATNVFKPISATTGEPIDSEDDPAALKVSRSAPINFDQPVVLGRLKPNKRYRIKARAYNSSGALISTDDAYSYIEVTLTDDDRPEVSILPVKLVDVPFAATTSVTVSVAAGVSPQDYDRVVASLYTVAGGQETAVTGGSTEIARTALPKAVVLSNLHANTTYRVRFTVKDAASAEIATASLSLNVTNNDAPATLSFEVALPAPPVFVALPAGTFTMGSPAEEPRYSDEAAHQVTLTQRFYIQTTEVIQAQWRSLMGNNSSFWSSNGDFRLGRTRPYVGSRLLPAG